MHQNACLLQQSLHGGFVAAADTELEGSYFVPGGDAA